jgi:hypothetical protein
MDPFTLFIIGLTVGMFTGIILENEVNKETRWND